MADASAAAADSSERCPWDRMAEDAAQFGVELSPPQIDRMRRYQELLCEWNQRFNLTAIQSPDEIVVKHFLDSLSCRLLVRFEEQQTLIDVGTGAGFPGLVLKIAYPHLQVTLLDAVQKRLNFLERVIEELHLEEVRTVHARAEEAALPPLLKPSARKRISRSETKAGLPAPFRSGVMREAFYVVTARAVARLNVLTEWLLPFARVGGAVLAMKGPNVGDEVAEAASAIAQLGGGAPTVREFVLPRTDIGRSLVLIPKVRPTPRQFPRPPGTARKHPL